MPRFAQARSDRKLDRQYGYVVLRPFGSLPQRDFRQQGRNALVQGHGPRLVDCFQEPGIAKLLAGRVHCLGDAIGVEVQSVSSPQADRPLLEGAVGQTDREPLALKKNRTRPSANAPGRGARRRRSRTVLSRHSGSRRPTWRTARSPGRMGRVGSGARRPRPAA